MLGWLDTAIDFLGDNGPDILGIGGTIAGALGQAQGARNPKTVTAQWDAGMQPEAKSQMEALLGRIQNFGNTGYQGIPRRGLTADDTDPTFGSKARQQLYQFYNNPKIQEQVAAKQAAGGESAVAASNGMSPDMMEMMVRNSAQDIQNPKLRSDFLFNLERIKKMDGTTNKYSGNKADFKDWLDAQMKMGNSGARNQLIPQANAKYDAGLQRAGISENAVNFDPTRSFLDKILPMIAVAAITGGAGLAGAPATASNIIKGVSTATGQLR